MEPKSVSNIRHLVALLEVKTVQLMYDRRGMEFGSFIGLILRRWAVRSVKSQLSLG